MIKFFFNLAQLALVSCVMIIIVHVAAKADPGFGWLTWGSVLVATQLGGVLTIAHIIAAIALTEGHVSRDQVRQMFGMDFVVTITSTALALVCSILWVERPLAAPLLLVPIMVAFLGYRAYVRERQGHEKVKFLYEANRTLSESPEVAVALEGLLERALEAFRAEQAEVILFASDGGVPLRTGLGPGTAREAMEPVDADAADRAARARRELRRGRRADGAVPGDRRSRISRSAACATACSACCAARTASSARSCSRTATGSRAASPAPIARCSRRWPPTPAPRSSTTASSRPSPSCATSRTSSSTRPTTTR